MKRIIRLWLVFMALGTLHAQNTFRKQPYLLPSGDETGIFVQWQTYQNASCRIEWGTDTAYADGEAAVESYGPDYQYHYRFDNLLQGTHYYYQVVCATDTVRGDFFTGPSGDAVYAFYAYGDTRSQPQTHDQVAQAIVADFQNDTLARTFIVNSGDLVEDGDEESDWDNEFFSASMPSVREMMRRLPYLAAVGNHEGNGILFAKYFPYPMMADGTNYYAFDYGPVHFTVIDQYDDYSPGSTQYNWIKNDLEQATKPWKIVLMHKPAWSAGGHSNDEETQTYLVPLFEQNGVSLVINGHNHYYARAVKDDITYLTTGGGGAPLYNPDSSYPYVVKVDRSYHFLKIILWDDRQLEVKAIRADGSLIESFTVNNNHVGIRLVHRDDRLKFGSARGLLGIFNRYDEPVEVSLYDMAGRLIRKEAVPAGNTYWAVQRGMYMVSVRTPEQNLLTLKVVVP